MSVEEDVLKRLGYSGKEAREYTKRETTEPDYPYENIGSLFGVSNEEIETWLRAPYRPTPGVSKKQPAKRRKVTQVVATPSEESISEEKSKNVPITPVPKSNNEAPTVVPIVETTEETQKEHTSRSRWYMEETKERYKLIILGYNQTYISRIKLESQKKQNGFEFWCVPLTNLLCLSLVVAKNIDKFTVEELREFHQIFKTADIAHDPHQSEFDRKRALQTVTALVEQSIPRYAYILDTSEEQIRRMMENEKAILNRTQTSIIREDGGLIIGRNLNLRQNSKQPERMVSRGKIIPITSHPKEESLDYIRRTIEEESNLKKHLAYLLKKSFNNIREFEAKYQKFKNYRTHVRDIAKTINPILRNEKIKKMEEHLFKLERYHRTITALYNNMYQVLLNDAFEVSPSELIQVESLFLLYESITSMLSNSIGDLPITTMERRRLRLQEQINKYNEYIEQISSGDQPASKRV